MHELTTMNEPRIPSHLQYASRVRAAQTSDLGEIAELIDRASTLSNDLDELEDLVRGNQLIVLDVAGDIRGVAAVRIERNRGHLGFVVLDAVVEGEGFEARLRGVASALCASRGCPALE